jgi:hypothetical protein
MRRVIVVLSRLSVLLSVALAALWIASLLGYGRSLSARWTKNHPPTFCVFVGRGHLGIGLFRHLPNDQTPPGDYAIYVPREAFQNVFGTYDSELMFFHVQLSALIALTGAPILILMMVRKRSFDSGLCPSCGYDVRATTRRCPECGAVLDLAGKSAHSHTRVDRAETN